MHGLTYSLADQNFERGKSLGILNVSVNLLHHLSRRPEIGQLTVLANSTLNRQLPTGAAREIHDEVLRGPLHRMAWDLSLIHI